MVELHPVGVTGLHAGGSAQRFKPNAMKVLTSSSARFSLSRARIKRLLLAD